MSRKVAKVHRVSLWRAHRRRCALCGKLLKRQEITIDHIVPLAHGGPHVKANWQPAHEACNLAKGTMSMAEWEALQARISRKERRRHFITQARARALSEEAANVETDPDPQPPLDGPAGRPGG